MKLCNSNKGILYPFRFRLDVSFKLFSVMYNANIIKKLIAGFLILEFVLISQNYLIPAQLLVEPTVLPTYSSYQPTHSYGFTQDVCKVLGLVPPSVGSLFQFLGQAWYTNLIAVIVLEQTCFRRNKGQRAWAGASRLLLASLQRYRTYAGKYCSLHISWLNWHQGL